MSWILDRQRYWAFFKAYVVCFSALVGLFIVVHAFTNIDEFSEVAAGWDLVELMGRYYLVRTTYFYDRLCGVITMMAAIFTVTWMQRDNQLLAILAAGISTQRAIRPVLVGALVVSALAVVNQEVVLPQFQTELQINADDDGRRHVPVTARWDVNNISLHGQHGDRRRRSIVLSATLPIELTGTLRSIQAMDAIHVPRDHPTAPLTGGWLLRGAQVIPALTEPTAGPLIRLSADELTGFPDSKLDSERLGGEPEPLRNFRAFNARVLGPAGLAAMAVFPRRDEEIYFLKTNVSFEMMTRTRQWYQFASTKELLESLADPSNGPEHRRIEVFLHGRLMRPFLTLALLGIGLPLVLSGYQRNTFVNLALALATSTIFYVGTFLANYLGDNGWIAPDAAAWYPLIGFGALATARWGRIRT